MLNACFVVLTCVWVSRWDGKGKSEYPCSVNAYAVTNIQKQLYGVGEGYTRIKDMFLKDSVEDIVKKLNKCKR